MQAGAGSFHVYSQTLKMTTVAATLYLSKVHRGSTHAVIYCASSLM